MTPNSSALRVRAGDGFSAFGAWIEFAAILTLAAWQFQVSPLHRAAGSADWQLPGSLAGPAPGRWCSDTKQILQASIALRLRATGALSFCQDAVATSTSSSATNVTAASTASGASTCNDEREPFGVMSAPRPTTYVVRPLRGSSKVAKQRLLESRHDRKTLSLSGLTDSFWGSGCQPLVCLGFLQGARGVDYHSDNQRPSRLSKGRVAGAIPAAVAMDDHAGVRYETGAVARVVRWRPGATAYTVTLQSGQVVETPYESTPVAAGGVPQVTPASAATRIASLTAGANSGIPGVYNFNSSRNCQFV